MLKSGVYGIAGAWICQIITMLYLSIKKACRKLIPTGFFISQVSYFLFPNFQPFLLHRLIQFFACEISSLADYQSDS